MFRSAPELNRTKQFSEVLPCELTERREQRVEAVEAKNLYASFGSFFGTHLMYFKLPSTNIVD